MNFSVRILNWLFGLGAIAVVPLYIIIIGYGIRLRSSRIFKAALTAAVGFSGLYALIGILSANISPASKAMSSLIGTRLSMLDVGWPVLCGVMFSLKVALPAIVGMLLLNVLLLAIGWVKTMDGDIFNMACIIWTMMAVYFTTKSWILAIIALIVEFVTLLKLADWTQPIIEPIYGLPGITTPHPNGLSWAPFGFFMNYIWDRIPVIRDINLDPETLRRKFGVFGQPMALGIIIGAIFGGIAYFRWPITLKQISAVYSLLLILGFFMVVLPRATELIIEGIAPLATGVRNLALRRKSKREIYLGVDIAVFVGAPEHVALGVLVIPFVYLWAVLLPHQKILPLVDAGVLFIFTTVYLINTNRRNLFRGLLNVILIELPFTFFTGNKLIPIFQKLVAYSGFHLSQGSMTTVTTLGQGVCVFTWPFATIFSFIGGKGTVGDFIIALLFVVAYGVLLYVFRKRPLQYAEELKETS